MLNSSLAIPIQQTPRWFEAFHKDPVIALERLLCGTVGREEAFPSSVFCPEETLAYWLDRFHENEFGSLVDEALSRLISLKVAARHLGKKEIEVSCVFWKNLFGLLSFHWVRKQLPKTFARIHSHYEKNSEYFCTVFRGRQWLFENYEQILAPL